jgi:hypothetical protein
MTSNNRKFQDQLEEVKAVVKRGSRPTVGTNAVQPPTFNGNISWIAVRCQFEIVAGHNQRSDREKWTYFITALNGQTADVLPSIPTNMTYEDTLQVLENRFGDQHRCLMLSVNNKDPEGRRIPSRLCTAIELLAHRAYPTLTKDHIGREAGKAFA